jgi:hypothetical protein
VEGQVSQPQKTTSMIVVLYVWTHTVLVTVPVSLSRLQLHS